MLDERRQTNGSMDGEPVDDTELAAALRDREEWRMQVEWEATQAEQIELEARGIEEEGAYDDEALIRDMEQREDMETGFDVRYEETFAEAASWDLEEAAAAFRRIREADVGGVDVDIFWF